jgi:hypothetical protein
VYRASGRGTLGGRLERGFGIGETVTFVILRASDRFLMRAGRKWRCTYPATPTVAEVAKTLTYHGQAFVFGVYPTIPVEPRSVDPWGRTMEKVSAIYYRHAKG